MSGTPASARPDTEQTMAELRARIRTCRAHLADFAPADFATGEQRAVSPAWMRGNSVRGDRYMHRVGIANFRFHVTTAYAILRHHGVPLGKHNLIGISGFTDTTT